MLRVFFHLVIIWARAHLFKFTLFVKMLGLENYGSSDEEEVQRDPFVEVRTWEKHNTKVQDYY